MAANDPSFLDQAISWLSPGWGLRRQRDRAAALTLRNYDAATESRRTEGWNRSASDANAAQRRAIPVVRELARDLKRNNPWARRAIKSVVNDTIGRGIRPTAYGASEKTNQRTMELWRAWADSPLCDFAERLPFYGLQRLIMEAVVESGECIIRRYRGAIDGRPDLVPLQVRVLESDYLDYLRDGILGPGGGPIIQGVEFGAIDGPKAGKRVAYWLYEYHPGANRLWAHTFVSKRVPVEDVIHVYDIDRPEQHRGVGWLASAIAKLHDASDYDDAAVMRAKIAACFSAFVTSNDPSLLIGKQHTSHPKREYLEPGSITNLLPGETVTFGAPPVDGSYEPFMRTAQRALAAGVGPTYEAVSRDYSQTNYSSARMASLDASGDIHGHQWHMIIPHACHGIWDWFTETAVISGMLDERPRSRWTPPPPKKIDPEKEGLAATRNVRGGLDTLFEMIREQGHDPRAHIAEIAEGNRLLDEYGVVLDSDPRRTTASGGLVAKADNDNGAEEEGGARKPAGRKRDRKAPVRKKAAPRRRSRP